MNETEFKKILNQIISADKTPEYEYFTGDGDNNYLNANGIAPGVGARWTTPKDICMVWLTDIKNGTLNTALKDLMGK